jgi:hypothetical protein
LRLDDEREVLNLLPESTDSTELFFLLLFAGALFPLVCGLLIAIFH